MKSGVYAGSHKQLTSQERPGLCLSLSHRLTRAYADPPTLTPNPKPEPKPEPEPEAHAEA